MRRAGRIVPLLVSFLALAVSVAVAARKPTVRERAAIISTVKHSFLTRAVPGNEYTVRKISVSTVEPYAAGETVGIGPYVNRVQPAEVMLRRTNGRWRLIDVGSVVSCRDAPAKVFRDLRSLICR